MQLRGLFNKNGTNSMIFFLSISNILSNILTLSGGLITAKFLLPAELGLYSSFTILSSYIILAQLGIPMALGRNYSFYLGNNNIEKANKSVAIAHFWAITLGVSSLLGGAAVSVYFLLQRDTQFAVGAVTVAVISFEAFYVKQYLKVLYRSNRDFNKLSLINIISAFVGFLAVALVYLYGFYGLCIRAIIISSFELIVSSRWVPIRVKPEWSRENFFAELRTGFPIFVVSNIFSLWPVLQRTLILYLGSTHHLGLYSLVGMVLVSFESVAGAVGSVIYPTMAIQWGGGYSLNHLFKSSLKPILFAAGLFALVIPFLWFLIPSIVHYLLPNYSAGVEAAQWMLLAGFVSLFNVWINIYNVIERQKAKLFTFLTGVCVSLMFLYFLFRTKGMELEIFPQSLALGYFVIMIINLWFIKENKSLRHTLS